MVLVDLSSEDSISSEISKIKNTLSKMKNKKVAMEEITDSEPEEEQEEEQEEEEEEAEQQEEQEAYDPEEKEEEEKEEEEKEEKEDDKPEEVKEEKQSKKSIDLTRYTKKEIKILLSAFEVNITRLIKKYKNVDDISENELHKIQNKFDSEYKFFDKKSRKLLNKLSHYDDLTKAEYNKINNKIKKITNKFTSFIKEFLGSDHDDKSESDEFEFSD